MIRHILEVTILCALLLGGVTALGAVTITSPLAPTATPTSVPGTLKVSLPAPPPVPAAGLVLGFVGATGQETTGTVSFNFAPAKLQPVSFDLLLMNNLKIPALGVFVPASKVVAALGWSPPAGSVWAVFLAAVGGGPWGTYSEGKFTGGLYYRATVLQVSF